MDAAEELSVMLAPTGDADDQDCRLSMHPVVIDSGDDSATVRLTASEDQDVGVEMVMFDAVVSGDAKKSCQGCGPSCAAWTSRSAAPAGFSACAQEGCGGGRDAPVTPNPADSILHFLGESATVEGALRFPRVREVRSANMRPPLADYDAPDRWMGVPISAASFRWLMPPAAYLARISRTS